MTGAATITLDTPSGARTALVRAPAATDSSPRPLVVLLHGAGGTAALAMGNTGWTRVADREGILLAYPEGTRRDPEAPPMFRQNPQAWNDGSGRGHTARQGIDDVAFLSALLTRLASEHGADPARTYLAGFSNGGSMAFRAGAALAARIAAIGPVAGHCWVEPRTLEPPVPALMMFGGLDPLNPPAGGEVTTPWGTREYHPPVLDSFDRWRGLNGCSGAPVVHRDATGVEAHEATGCGAKAEVRCLVVQDLGHHWPGGPRLLPPWIAGPASDRVNGAAALWEFFRRHRRD
jgi:polyhydroxybutyrate depolymerase